MKEGEIKLRPLWDGILGIYKAFAKVCEDNQLRFYLAYGSALGAVRHHGFIPWDDDLDVMMPRPDFDKFCEIAGRNLPRRYKLVTPYNTREFIYGFAKIQDSDETEYRRVKSESGLPLGQGIFLDIFPLDGVPSGKLQQLVWKLWFLSFWLKYRYELRVDYGTCKSKWARRLGFFLMPFFPSVKSEWMYYHERIKRLSRLQFSQSSLCGINVDLINRSRLYQAFPCAWLGDPVYVDFEGLQVPIPQDADSYLRFNYGDYLKLPPLEKRRLPTHFDEKNWPWKFGPTGNVE